MRLPLAQRHWRALAEKLRVWLLFPLDLGKLHGCFHECGRSYKIVGFWQSLSTVELLPACTAFRRAYSDLCWHCVLMAYNCFEQDYSWTLLQNKRAVAKNIETESRGASVLFIWTDCDREGEHIGTEIRDIAQGVNSRLEVKRAKFSNIERE